MLHTRATSSRIPGRARGSRNIFVAICGAAMLAALAACGSDSTTAPNNSVVGDYALQTVDGKAPPDTVIQTGTTTVVFLDGSLSLKSDATYKLLFHSTTTTGSGTTADSSGSTGTYTVSGSTVVIRNSSTGDSVIATATPPTITFTDNSEVFVFSK